MSYTYKINHNPCILRNWHTIHMLIKLNNIHILRNKTLLTKSKEGNYREILSKYVGISPLEGAKTDIIYLNLCQEHNPYVL